MARIVHKKAIREASKWSYHPYDLSKGEFQATQLCREYAPYLAKNPILSEDWKDVTCEHCHSGRFNQVPDKPSGISKLQLELLNKKEDAGQFQKELESL